MTFSHHGPTDKPKQIPEGSLSSESPSPVFSFCLEFAGERGRWFFRRRKPPVPVTPLCVSAQEPVSFCRPRAGANGRLVTSCRACETGKGNQDGDTAEGRGRCGDFQFGGGVKGNFYLGIDLRKLSGPVITADI